VTPIARHRATYACKVFALRLNAVRANHAQAAMRSAKMVCASKIIAKTSNAPQMSFVSMERAADLVVQ
jgi:hypothetical protein